MYKNEIGILWIIVKSQHRGTEKTLELHLYNLFKWISKKNMNSEYPKILNKTGFFKNMKLIIANFKIQILGFIVQKTVIFF